MSTYSLLSCVYEELMDDVVYALYLSLLEKYTKPCKTLEAGCGTAYLSRELARKGYTPHAFDSNIEMLEAAAYFSGEEDLEVTLFDHDLLHPLTGRYDVVLMPVDVINHATDFQTAQRMFENATAVLNKQGVLLYDYLKCDYIESLVGHEEIIPMGDKVLTWKVLPSTEPCAHVHVVSIDGKTATHTSRSYPKEVMETLHASLELLELVELKERIIVVLKK